MRPRGIPQGAKEFRRSPPWVRIALRILVPKEEREFFLGDLEESFRTVGSGQRPVRTWTREVLGALSLRMNATARISRAPGPGSRLKGDGMLQELLSDLRFGIRSMVRSPGFAVVALLTMALGIGANTAMFSIVNGVILRPLPYPEADRIVRLWESNLSRGWSTFSISPPNFADWVERNSSLELLGAYQISSVTYTGGDRPQSLSAYRVTEDWLPILGGEPIQGRGIAGEDLDPEQEAVVVLTYGFWQGRLGGDPDVLGRALTLDGTPHTVVGVLSRDWEPPARTRADVILPLQQLPPWYPYRSSHFIQALGRLKPGVSLQQTQAEFSSLAAALEAEYPDTNTGWGAVVRSLEDVLLGSTRPQLLIFMASVGLVLLIACANLANMTLARASVRARELAIRTAVGAGKGRVIRQLLAESVLLAAVGGAIGVGLAYLALESFVTGWPTLLPRMREIQLNAPVLLFSLGLSLASGVLFGLAPAVAAAGPNLQETLRQGGRGLAGDRSRRWMRTGLVVGEVGLAVMLLVGTGLLVRSFAALSGEDPGFRTENRLVLSTPLPGAKYADDVSRRAFAEATLTRIQALSGVESAALTSLIPIGGSDEIWGFWIHGRVSESGDGDGSALFYRVSPGYFDAMGIPVLAGRVISPDDREDGLPVVVVSGSMAEQFFPGENPLGQHIRFGTDADDPLVEVIGVVGDVQHYNLGRVSIPQMYVPFSQRPTGNVNFVLRTSSSPLDLIPGVRDAVESVDPDQPLEGVQAADALVSESISTPRFRTLLMTIFGSMALLLAVVGLYGVMAYSVAQRTKEIGVRMALGASRGSVLGLVFREGGPLVGVGLGVGLAGALALSRVLGSMLFGVGVRDPAVFAVVPLILTVVAATAMLVPARRATRVDPVRTLAGE